MMLSNHNAPIALKTLLKQNVVWKLLEIASSPSGGIIMMSFRVALDEIDCIIKVFPKLDIQVIRDICLFHSDLSGILRRSRVDDQWLHRAT